MAETASAPWVVPSPAGKYGGAFLGPQQPTRDETTLTDAAGPARGGRDPVWSPHNPLFWFGAIAAVTFGLMAASTSVRVGPIKASITAGS